MTLILERLEGGVAVLETSAGHVLNVPAELLAKGVREGDVLRLIVDDSGELLGLEPDFLETRKRREAAARHRASLPTAPEGDFEL